MGLPQQTGIVEKASSYSVEQTVERLERLLQEKGIVLFAVIDHSGEAKKAGYNMPSTKLLIFGNPKAGTPLMLSAPSIAIDLPLKILVREDAGGKVWVSWNSPEYLLARHNVPAELLKNISAAETLATQAGT